MRWIALCIVLISVNANCEDKLAEAIREINKEKTEFIAEQIIEARWGDRKKPEEPATEEKPKKKLKECIKPNNVIDDEVRRCMKGK